MRLSRDIDMRTVGFLRHTFTGRTLSTCLLIRRSAIVRRNDLKPQEDVR